MKKLLLMILAAVFLSLCLLSTCILVAPHPSYRAQRIFFGTFMPVFQFFAGFENTENRRHLYGFQFERPETLTKLKNTYHLSEIIAGARNDFEAYVSLMHWVRDQFPHKVPYQKPPSQAFNGYEVLKQKNDQPGFLCGTTSQLLVQAITSVGGYARRVELRFTPKDAHAVVEAWSELHFKWFVLDPDYDVYYTLNDVPQHAIELHRHWAANEIDSIQIHHRESPNNIYKTEYANMSRKLLRKVYETKDDALWERDTRGRDSNYFNNARFAVKLLNYYSQISYPLRNNWVSKPLKWYHPLGNHVQNSLVIQLATMPYHEDFLHRIPDEKLFYVSPKRMH
jgi:hypothetical protein